MVRFLKISPTKRRRRFKYPLMDFSGPKREFGIGSSAITTAIVVLLRCLATWSANIPPTASASSVTHRTYTTKFPLTENPISEERNWLNGQTVGLDWANVQTTPGFAFGTEAGTVNFDDSTALLTGAWGANQAAQAKVRSVNQKADVYEEVELRLRSSLSAHNATGYEINFRCSKTMNAYAQIVRWNGPLGSFTYLKTANGSQYGVANGDVVKATIVGKVITAYINGTQVLQATDYMYASGSPGMGFYLQGATGVAGDYGFTSFAATDEPTAGR